MVNETAPAVRLRHRASLAPAWHTAALIGLLLTVALTGVLLQRHGVPSGAASARSALTTSRILTQYLPLLVVNGSLLLYTCRLFRPRNMLPDLLGVAPSSLRRAIADCVLACACFVLVMSLELVSTRLLGVGRNAAIRSLLPSTGAERLTWVLVALSAGFCEEVVYRGYLQTQLAAFTRSRALGVVLQAALFGIAHLEQGADTALRVAGYGLLFGVLACIRRSLWPGIGAHALLDLASLFVH